MIVRDCTSTMIDLAHMRAELIDVVLPQPSGGKWRPVPEEIHKFLCTRWALAFSHRDENGIWLPPYEILVPRPQHRSR